MFNSISFQQEMLLSVLRKKKCALSPLAKHFSLSSNVCADFTDLRIYHPDSYGLPKEADVIVCGGGVVGASVAYYLAQMGWGPRTILLEQAR